MTDSTRGRYLLENTDDERARLARQAQSLDAMTRRLLLAAGIGRGMRVLDVGCGAGDVTALAAELVGPTGAVVGYDADPGQVAAASARWGHLPSVEFSVGRIVDLPAAAYDAVVGRLVLIYQPDLDAAMRALSGACRTGGVVVSIEPCVDLSGRLSLYWPPPGPLEDRIDELSRQGAVVTAMQQSVGLRIPRVMQQAGLDPQRPYEIGALVYEGREAADALAGIMQSMMPILRSAGVDLEGFDVDSLADRLYAEHGDDRVTLLGPHLGVWAVKL